jgi:tRNA threonylcarbamoyl adenosine modification protein YeaZ
MKILAIEQSTAMASVAVLVDGEVVCERRWVDARAWEHRFFPILEEVIREAPLDLAEVDGFAVGIGPGSFSGIRIAVAAARAFAAPGARPVAGVPSAQALAEDVARESGAGAVTIVGDARRNQMWVAGYRDSGGRMEEAHPISLAALDRLSDTVLEGSVVATSEWDRLGSRLRDGLARDRLIEESRFAVAGVVGRLAWLDARQGRAGREPVPIYLHPPVSAAPKEGMASCPL